MLDKNIGIMHIPLNKSYKNIFPFRLGTTSFIYKDNWQYNAKMLAPYLDEIELLQFESRSSNCFPSRSEITELAITAEEFKISYNIHLPIDINPGDSSRSEREYAVEIIIKSIDLFSTLSPTTYTLHLPFMEKNDRMDAVKTWQDSTAESIQQVLQAGIPGNLLSIETLDYPFEWAENMIDDLSLKVCLDIGHLIRYGFDYFALMKKHLKNTAIVHLHGVENNEDHLSLEIFATEDIEKIFSILKDYSGSLSIEVFNFNNLKRSLNYLEMNWI